MSQAAAVNGPSQSAAFPLPASDKAIAATDLKVKILVPFYINNPESITFALQYEKKITAEAEQLVRIYLGLAVLGAVIGFIGYFVGSLGGPICNSISIGVGGGVGAVGGGLSFFIFYQEHRNKQKDATNHKTNIPLLEELTKDTLLKQFLEENCDPKLPLTVEDLPHAKTLSDQKKLLNATLTTYWESLERETKTKGSLETQLAEINEFAVKLEKPTAAFRAKHGLQSPLEEC